MRPTHEGYYLKDFGTFVEEIPEQLLVGAFEDEVDDYLRDQRSMQKKLQREALQRELEERKKAREARLLRNRYVETLKKRDAEREKALQTTVSAGMRNLLNEFEIDRLNGEIDQINYAIHLSYSRYNSQKIRSDRRAFQRTIDSQLAEISRRQRKIEELGGSYLAATELPAIERPVRTVRACSGSS